MQKSKSFEANGSGPQVPSSSSVESFVLHDCGDTLIGRIAAFGTGRIAVGMFGYFEVHFFFFDIPFPIGRPPPAI
jgi:hypothetical protein